MTNTSEILQFMERTLLDWKFVTKDGGGGLGFVKGCGGRKLSWVCLDHFKDVEFFYYLMDSDDIVVFCG